MTPKPTPNPWQALVAPEEIIKGDEHDRPKSARSKRHDWDELYRIVDADSKADIKRGIDWDEHYVPAIERALRGRKPDDLLRMLDEGRLLHPALLPALADVIRSQHDDAKGRPRTLTRRQVQLIRQWYDLGMQHLFTGCPEDGVIEWLAEAHGTTVAIIRAALKEAPEEK